MISCCLITGRNEVVAKVMFLQASVILSTGGEGVVSGEPPQDQADPPPPDQGEPPPPTKENPPPDQGGTPLPDQGGTAPPPRTKEEHPPRKKTAAYGQ